MSDGEDDPRRYTPAPPGRGFALWLAVVALVVALTAVVFVVLQHVRLRRDAEARTQRSTQGRTVTVAHIDRSPAQMTLKLPGEIRGYVETPVYAKVSGHLARIADKGDTVKAGSVLAELESPDLLHEVQNARATFELKRVTNQRTEALRKTGVVSQQEADQSQGDYRAAAATLQQLEAMQGYLRITADVDGVVTARYVDPGTLIPQSTGSNLGASTPILALATLSPLRVYVDVPQSDAPFVRDGDRAVVTVGEYAGREFVGAITRHPQALAPGTRTMLVEVDLPNEDHALLPGMYARVAIEQASRPTAPRIPDDALVFRDGKTWAAVVDDSKIRLAPVTLGNDDGRSSEVTSGLSGDETIAVNVGQAVRDGEVVQVRDPKQEPPGGTPGPNGTPRGSGGSKGG